MFPRLLAVAIVSYCLSAAAAAQAADELTLDEVLRRVVAVHPDLRVFRHRSEALAVEADVASLSPPMTVGAELENFAGTGALSGFDRAELTLSLAALLERGGKRDARQAIAAAHVDALAAQRAAAELDLLAEAARRYLDLVSAQARERIAAQEVQLRLRTVGATERQLRAGAAPEAALLAAEALQARAELEVARAATETGAAWRRLATLWGGVAEGPAPRASAAVLELPRLPPLSSLLQIVERTPQLRQFADATRIAEARLHFAQSSRATDLEWRIGLRHLREGDDWGLVAGVSVPLGSARRAEPSIRAARAELERISVERESAALLLDATLVEAHARFSGASLEVERIRDEWLPRLSRAEAAAERAYRAGALGYLEWAQLQAETTAARRQQLVAAIEAHRALIEIQRLTGEPFVASPAHSEVSP